MKSGKLVLAAVLALTTTALFAQTATPAPVPAPAPAPAVTKPVITSKGIAARKENQQDRIAAGVKNGQLNPAQTARLEHQEAGINKEERGMRAQDNGKLSKADKRLLNRQQNQESRRIHHDRHHG